MIKISADSTCDLSPKQRQLLDVAIAPLSITVGDRVYKDGIDIHPADIFTFVEEGQSCQTGAVNIYEYQKHFEKLAVNNEAVIHICLGSGFSSCYNNAVIAAQGFSNVYIVDSMNLSGGSGHLVHDAANLARQNVEPVEIKRRLEESVSKLDSTFLLNQLDYLAKGGRCSAISAQGAKILRLKPSIEVRSGAMIVGRKYRGTLQKSIEAYLNDRLNTGPPLDPSRVILNQTGCDPWVMDLMLGLIEEHNFFEEIIVTEAGCTISNHCGPQTVGVFLKRL